MRLPGDARLDRSQRERDRGFGGFLHVRIDRRVDAQASFVDGILSEPLDELAANDFLEMESAWIFMTKLVVQHDLSATAASYAPSRSICCSRIRLEHEVAPLDGAIRSTVGFGADGALMIPASIAAWRA